MTIRLSESQQGDDEERVLNILASSSIFLILFEKKIRTDCQRTILGTMSPQGLEPPLCLDPQRKNH